MHGFLHGRGRELAGDGASGFVARDQTRIGKHVEMLHDGGQRHLERFRQLADGNAVLFIQSRQQGPPCGIGERGEHAVERGVLGGILILNHKVKYWVERPRSQPVRAENFSKPRVFRFSCRCRAKP